MSLSSHKIEQSLTEAGNDLWNDYSQDINFDSILQTLSKIHAQVEVQRRLQQTAVVLRQQPKHKILPNQHATRVKRFLKFFFEQTPRGGNRSKELRKLECNVLKFCGLCHTIEDIIHLPEDQFEFLIQNITDFVHRQDLTPFLYRHDIDKAVNRDLNPEDDAVFKEFLKCSFTLVDINLVITIG